jgi:RNA polymerase sigma factor (TIGR02999 family)
VWHYWEEPSLTIIMSDVTLILNAMEAGDGHAIEKLLPAVYQELRQLAAQKLSSERPGHTLQATALVHEAYLRLAGLDDQSLRSRTYFFGAAAEAMRRILIDNHRRRQSCKRGGDLNRVELEEDDLAIEAPSDDLVALDEALAEFEKKDSAKAELVKLRYFAGLTLEEAASLMGISESTAKRYWRFARAWLFGRIRTGG